MNMKIPIKLVRAVKTIKNTKSSLQKVQYRVGTGYILNLNLVVDSLFRNHAIGHSSIHSASHLQYGNFEMVSHPEISFFKVLLSIALPSCVCRQGYDDTVDFHMATMEGRMSLADFTRRSLTSRWRLFLSDSWRAGVVELETARLRRLTVTSCCLSDSTKL